MGTKKKPLAYSLGFFFVAFRRLERRRFDRRLVQLVSSWCTCRFGTARDHQRHNARSYSHSFGHRPELRVELYLLAFLFCPLSMTIVANLSL